MKHFPVFLLIIPAGLIVVLFMLFLSFHLETIVVMMNSWFFGTGRPGYELLFYLAAAAIPLLSGVFMCLVIIFISRVEDKRYEREREEALRRRAGGWSKIMGSVDSINASIVKLREISVRMRDQTRRLSLLGLETAGEKPERQKDICAETRAETLSVTMEDSEVSGVRIIYPAGFLQRYPGCQEDPSPQAPVPPHESHRKIWYFPNI
jgi:hypothetical protein